jgi:hypothetical protein
MTVVRGGETQYGVHNVDNPTPLRLWRGSLGIPQIEGYPRVEGLALCLLDTQFTQRFHLVYHEQPPFPHLAL